MAFLELALAVKFLSNADLVMHWGLLTRTVFIVIWILIALSLSIYLFKKDLIVLSIFAFALTGYLMYALKNPVAILSGFAPPYHDAKLKPAVVNDYAKALELARQQHKPLLIDFTGWACVNCRKMEEQVWTDASVSRLIQDRFILVSLYVDDRGRLRIPPLPPGHPTALRNPQPRRTTPRHTYGLHPRPPKFQTLARIRTSKSELFYPLFYNSKPHQNIVELLCFFNRIKEQTGALGNTQNPISILLTAVHGRFAALQELLLTNG